MAALPLECRMGQRWLDEKLDELIPEHWYANKLLWMLMREPEENDAGFLDVAESCLGKNIDTDLVRDIVEGYLPLYRELYYQSEAMRKAGIAIDDPRGFAKTVLALALSAPER